MGFTPPQYPPATVRKAGEPTTGAQRAILKGPSYTHRRRMQHDAPYVAWHEGGKVGQEPPDDTAHRPKF